MRPFASYEITLRGTLLDVKEAIDCNAILRRMIALLSV